MNVDDSLNDIDYTYTRNYFANTEFATMVEDEYETVYYNHNVYGKITLYAGWQANTYKVVYDYGTYGIDTGTNKYGTEYTTHKQDGVSVYASIKQLRKTTSPLQSNSGDYESLVFDVEYDPQYVTRIGYTFMGWRFGLTSKNSVSGFEIDHDDDDIIASAREVTTDGKVDIASKGNKICLSYNTIYVNNFADTNATTTDCYLYYDKSKQYSSEDEFIGNFEQLGDNECGVVTNGNGCDPKLNHYIGMFAMWKRNIYTVHLDVNTSVRDTTEASYFLSNNKLEKTTVKQATS